MQAQAHPTSAQGGDFLKMTPGEQEEMVPPQRYEEHGEKKSVVGKVKDKAKKLTSKFKDKTKMKKKDEHGKEIEGDTTSSTSSEEEAEDTPREGLQETKNQGATPEVRHDGVVHGGEELGGEELGSRGLDAPRTEESRGLMSGATADPSAPAPGAAWPSSRDEPRAATSQEPSWGETNKRQQEVTSAIGQESAGIASSGLNNTSRDLDSSSLAAGALAGSTNEKIPEGVKEDPKPLVDSAGRDVSADVMDTQEEPKEEVQGLGSSEKVEEPKKELKPSDSQKGWMQRATESVASVKNVLMGSPKSATTTESTAVPSVEQENSGQEAKTWTDKAREAATSVKETIGSKLPSSTSPKEVPASEEHPAPSITSRAVESATAIKDTVASKLGGGGGDQVQSSEVDSGTQTTQPGMTQKVMDMKDAVVSKLGYGAGAESETGAKAGNDDKSSKLFTPDEHDTALSQKITDMLTLGGSKSNSGGAQDVSSETAGTTDSSQQQGKGVMERVSGVMGSLLGKKAPDDKPAAADLSEGNKDTVMSDPAPTA